MSLFRLLSAVLCGLVCGCVCSWAASLQAGQTEPDFTLGSEWEEEANDATGDVLPEAIFGTWEVAMERLESGEWSVPSESDYAHWRGERPLHELRVWALLYAAHLVRSEAPLEGTEPWFRRAVALDPSEDQVESEHILALSTWWHRAPRPSLRPLIERLVQIDEQNHRLRKLGANASKLWRRLGTKLPETGFRDEFPALARDRWIETLESLGGRVGNTAMRDHVRNAASCYYHAMRHGGVSPEFFRASQQRLRPLIDSFANRTLPRCLYFYGSAEYYVGDTRLAVAALEASLAAYNRLGYRSTRRLGQYYQSLAYAYYDLRDFEASLHYTEESLRLRESASPENDTLSTAYSLRYLGHNQFQLGSYRLALDAFKRTDAVFQREALPTIDRIYSGMLEEMIRSALALGETHLAMEKLDHLAQIRRRTEKDHFFSGERLLLRNPLSPSLTRADLESVVERALGHIADFNGPESPTFFRENLHLSLLFRDHGFPGRFEQGLLAHVYEHPQAPVDTRILAAYLPVLATEGRAQRRAWRTFESTLRACLPSDHFNASALFEGLSFLFAQQGTSFVSAEDLAPLLESLEKADVAPIALSRISISAAKKAREERRYPEMRAHSEAAFRQYLRMTPEDRSSNDSIVESLGFSSLGLGDYQRAVEAYRQGYDAAIKPSQINLFTAFLARAELCLEPANHREIARRVPKDIFENQLRLAVQQLMANGNHEAARLLSTETLAPEALVDWENATHFRTLVASHQQLIDNNAASAGDDTDRDPSPFLTFAQSVLDCFEQGLGLPWLTPADLRLLPMLTADDAVAARDLLLRGHEATFSRPEDFSVEVQAAWREAALRALLRVPPSPEVAIAHLEAARAAFPDELKLLATLSLIAEESSPEKAASTFADLLAHLDVQPPESSSEWEHPALSLGQYFRQLSNEGIVPPTALLPRLRALLDTVSTPNERIQLFRHLISVGWNAKDHPFLVEWYGEFLDEGAGLLSASERVDLLSGKGNALTHLDAYEEAIQSWTEALEGWKQIAVPSLADWRTHLELRLSRIDFLVRLGRRDQATADLAPVAALVEVYLEPNDLLRVDLALWSRRLRPLASTLEETLAPLEAARSNAIRNGAWRKRVTIDEWIAQTYIDFGNPEEGIRRLEALLQETEERGLADTYHPGLRSNIAAYQRQNRLGDLEAIFAAQLDLVTAEDNKPFADRRRVIYSEAGFQAFRLQRWEEVRRLHGTARELADRDFEPRHMNTHRSLSFELAFSAIALGDISTARQEARELTRQSEQWIHQILLLEDNEGQLSLRTGTNPYTALAPLDLPEVMAEHSLRTKGLILENQLHIHALARTDGRRARYQRLQRDRIEAELGRRQRTAEDLTEFRRRARNEEQRFLAEFQAEGLEAIFSLTLADLTAALPPQAALLDFHQYSIRTENGGWEVHFGVLVLRPDGSVRQVPLGPAKPIRDALRLAREHLLIFLEQVEFNRREGNRAIAWASPHFAQFFVQQSKLHRLLWLPLEPILAESPLTRLYLVPDSELAEVSFGAFLDFKEGQRRFVFEDYELSYLNSARDLLGRPADLVLPSTGHFAALGGPTYWTGAPKPERDSVITPLEMTAEGAARLAETFSRSEWSHTLWTGIDASEENLAALNSPSVLHLATHGYYLSAHERENVRRLRLTQSHGREVQSLLPWLDADDPMYWNGLLLAGAEDLLDPTLDPNLVSTRTDGILTAAESTLLRLEDTFLVTFAACDAGVGQAVRQEGLLGLRRGFAMAGAQNLMTTLWPVLAHQTNDFYDHFYARLLEGKPIPTAHRESLLALRAEWAKEGAADTFGDLLFSYVFGAFVHLQLPGHASAEATIAPE